MVDDELVVDVEAGAVVAEGVEGVGFAEAGLDLSGPADAEGVGADGGVGRAAGPVEIDDGIDAADFGAGEVGVVVVVAAQAGAGADGGGLTVRVTGVERVTDCLLSRALATRRCGPAGALVQVKV